MTVPFIDLKAQYRAIESRVRAGIEGVLEHGQFIMGPEVAALENELASFAGVRHAVSCSSGTDALLMPLMAWGVGPGDAVFTSPFTFIATAEVVALLGATPVYVDIRPDTYNLDPERLADAVAEVERAGRLRPRVVIPVDIFGLPADYDAISGFAEDRGLRVLEDAAQSYGASYRGRRAGGLGHAAAVSFFPAKPLGCYGDGGAVLTDDDDLAERLRSIRVHGKGTDKYDNVRIGINARLDTMQAAVLLAKLEVFADELAARERIAVRYTAALDNLVATPHVPADCTSAWAQYSVRSAEREAIQGALKAAGIPSVIYYPKPLHLQSAFAHLGYRPGSFPVAELTSQEIFSLPMHPYLEEPTQQRIVDVIREARVTA